MGQAAPLDLTHPVAQVSCYEAEAFARFVGKRLPTEFEWEAAAGWDPEAQARRHYPWGNMEPTLHVANLDQLALQPAAVGAFPGNVSPIGCYGMIGDLWEWTSSEFLPYPGAQEDPASVPPLSGYSSGNRVLRGGSWATRPGAIRVTVRRPGSPESRHMFSGFRCARNA
jgi:iron(II)-dependent oxidoreductase